MEYNIVGGAFPVVVCKLESGESMITESGAMAWMTNNVKMETGATGGIGKGFGRMFSGESFFQNRYTAQGAGEIAFASSFPGAIRAFEIAPGKSIIAQKSAYLASTAGVELKVHFQKKIAGGFFGGEGFIMQEISGSGTAFVEIDGEAIEYTLAAGEQKVINTGYLAVMESTCTMDVVMIKGAANMLFGGEGLFNTVITGPGKIIIQTMPVSSMASAISRFLPSK